MAVARADAESHVGIGHGVGKVARTTLPAFPGRRTLRWAVAAVLCWALVSCGDDPTGPPPVATVEVTPETATVGVEGTVGLTATPRDASGATVGDATISWTSDATSVARVDETGVVTGVAPGSATITAASGEGSGTAQITVVAVAGDVSIESVIVTQGVQRADGSFPVVLDGKGAAVLATLAATEPVNATLRVVLRLVDGAGEAAHTDTATVPGIPDPDRPEATVLFYVPPSVLSAGLSWEVFRDEIQEDAEASNDRFPRSGTAALNTVTVPTLEVRFVPIMLTSHGNRTGQVNPGNLLPYMRTLQSVHPLGPVSTSVGDVFSSDASFGSPPSGGAAAFWIQVLGELDQARQADPDNNHAHWVGLVAPPAGFTFTEFGGFGYIPASYAAIGAGTRTSVVVHAGWFNAPTQTRDLVAHELGHNFGRRHAPCGGAGGPDPQFPNPGGTIGLAGHDVFARDLGLTSSLVTIHPSTGDVMGYCLPVWASAYTYEGVLAFRSGVVAVAEPRIERVLVVQGSWADGDVTLDPAVVIDARPSRPSLEGRWTLEGFSEDGSPLFRLPFEPARLDHSDARPFTLAVPLTDAISESLDRIAVSGPGGSATLERPDEPRLVAPAGVPTATAERLADGSLRITCADPGTRRTAVQDPVTGRLLGTGSGPSVTVLVSAAAAITVSCSDGVRSSFGEVVLP